MMASSTSDLKLVYIEKNTKNATLTVYYIFGANDGFVVVSGDDRARDILAYGDRALDLNAMPANMKYWLSLYKHQLEYLQDNPGIQVNNASLKAPQRVDQSVNPLLTAQWSQDAPYWNECPVFGTDTCYTGCPATSLSMVFHYWKYPQQRTPTVPPYTMPTYGVSLPELPPRFLTGPICSTGTPRAIMPLRPALSPT